MTKRIDIDAYEHAVRLWTVVLEISVLMAQFPSREIAQLSYDYRTLGLGYANVGGLLMSSGVAYDSAAGRAIAGALSAIMTGVAYATSAEMAKERGPFARFMENREAMLRVIRNHRRAALGEHVGYEKLATAPTPLDHAACPDKALIAAAERAWETALAPGRALWLSQRAGHRHRADRHHRPRHGLRHHRHRARFRAGEIQEAGRRRLSQDRQPRRAGSPSRARLSRERDRRDGGLCGRPRDALQRAGDQHRIAARQGFHGREAGCRREVARGRLRHKIRLQQMDSRRGFPHRRAKSSRRARSTTRTSISSRIWAFRARTSKPPMCTSAAR